MSYKGLPELLVWRINPGGMRAPMRLLRAGIVSTELTAKSLSSPSLPPSHLDQLIIPLDQGAPDYARRMAEVVENLAEKEGRCPLRF